MKRRRRRRKKEKRVGGLLGTIIIVVDVVLVLFLVQMVLSDEQHEVVSVEVPQALAENFTEDLHNAVTQTIGKSENGFTPEMYMRVYPGIKEVDFSGVQAEGGVYRYTIEDRVVLDQKKSEETTSADRAITTEGMRTLLSNIATRLGIDFDDPDDLEALVAKVNESRRGGEVDNIVQTGIGKGAFLYGVKVLPVEVVQDSRCPIDIECSDSGTIRILLKGWVDDKKQKETKVALGESISLGNTIVTFSGVSPVRVSDQEIASGEYELTFEIRKEKAVKKVR